MVVISGGTSADRGCDGGSLVFDGHATERVVLALRVALPIVGISMRVSA